MASAWGNSFGKAWGSSWGRIATASAGGAVSRGGSKRPLIAVVEVDGKSYRVPIDQAQEFFDALKQKVKALPKPVFKRRKKKGRIIKEVIEPIKIVIKSAPVEYFAQIEAMVDRTNEIFNTIWNRALQRYLLEMDDEEAILLLIH